MKILALEFSSPVRSVAVLAETRRGYAEESGGRETKAFELIEAALKQAGVAREEIECIVVGLGPGSYAGTRIAIAIAQGWQLAREVKLLGLSSAEVVAAQARSFGAAQSVSIGLEVRPGELYVTEYAVAESPVVTVPFRLVAQAERSQYEKSRQVLRMDWPPGLATPSGAALPPSADFLAMLASHRTGFSAGHGLEPIYLRDVQFMKSSPPRHGLS